MDAPLPWHRIFASSWVDFFRGLPVAVEPEKDLSLSKQLLDVLLIRKAPGPLECRLPDGFEELAGYNLLTFKSRQDKLSAWTLQELVGHYVNLRKQVSPSMDEDQLLPEADFRLYAVSARFPQQLASSGVGLLPVAEGVYEVQALTSRIRVIVANQLPQQEHNALLHLFSSNAELLEYAVQHYRLRSQETSTLLLELIQHYRQEGELMPDLLEQLAHDTLERVLKELSVEKRLELLQEVPLEKRLEGLTPEQRVQGLSPEELRALADKLQRDRAASHPE